MSQYFYDLKKCVPKKFPVDLTKIFWDDPILGSTTPFQTEVLLTNQRFHLYQNIIAELNLLTNKKRYKRNHIVTGIQGIGKSNSLWLFAHLLSQFPKKKPRTKFIFLPDCKNLNSTPEYYIIEQFKFHFPEKAEELNNLAKIKSWDLFRQTISNIVNYSVDDLSEFLFFIVDQINDAGTEGFKILKELAAYKWTLIIFSESANNHQSIKKELSLFISHSCEFFIEDLHEFCEVLLLEHPTLNQLEICRNVKDHNVLMKICLECVNKMKKYTSLNPREGVKVLSYKGKTIEEKIQNYVSQRIDELNNDFYDFLNNSNLTAVQTEDLLRSIFYMDQTFTLQDNPQSFFFETLTNPVIDRRTMISQKVGPHLWKISSAFPLVSTVLKQFSNLQRFSTTFYQERRQELFQFLNNASTDPRVRGVFYEEMTLLSLNIARTKKPPQLIALFLCSSTYLKKIISTDQYDVINNFSFD